MADTEKGNSSNKEAKEKMSILDEDFSKDFLSSWKSGGDDIDFDFQPVSKGKKKTFDFGMDMDFSLDDAFGKISSFKIDMPDFDFSSSPKKTTKPKDKTEEEPGKGNHQDKHDKFFFSFDFDSELTTGKLMKDKAPGDMNSKVPVGQAKNDGGRTELSASEDNREGSTHLDAVDKSVSVSCNFGSSKSKENNSDACPSSRTDELIKSSDLGDREKIAAAQIDAAGNSGHNEKNLDNSTSSCTKQLSKPELPLDNSEKIAAACTSPRGHDDTEYGEDRNEMSADAVLDGADAVHDGKEAKKGVHSLESEKIITNVKSSRDIDVSLGDAFGQTSSFKSDMPDVDLYSSPKKHTKPKEKSEEDTGNENHQDKHDKSFSYDYNGSEYSTLLKNKVLGDMNSEFPVTQATIESGRPELSALKDNEEGLTHIDAVDKRCSKYERGKPTENNPGDDYPSSCTKELSKPDSALEERERIAAAPIDIVDKGNCGGSRHDEKNSDECMSSSTEELTKSDSNLEKSHEVSAACIDVDKRYPEKKSDNKSSSCAKELIKPESVLEKSEKIAAAFTPSRDYDGTVYGKKRNKMSVDKVSHGGNEAKNGLPSLEHEKMINNVKSSGLKIPLVSSLQQGNKFGNQGQGKLNNKISGIASIQKLNIGQGNKLPSQKVDKKMFTLPSLNIKSSTQDKHPAALSTQRIANPPENVEKSPMQRIANSSENVEKSPRLQTTVKKVSPVSAEKKTPSTPTLKRKPSEVADMVPAKLHTPKRALTSESRVSKISARELEEGAQVQGSFLEGNRKNESVEYPSPKFDFSQEANIEALQFSTVVENDENVEKAEACSKELDNICNMLKKKHEEAKELLVRALVNNNNLLMLNHPMYEEKIRAVQRLASRLMSKELEVEA